MLVTIISGIVLGLVLGALIAMKAWPGVVFVSMFTIGATIIAAIESIEPPPHGPIVTIVSDEPITPYITITCHDTVCDTTYIYDGETEQY